jgi:hypothetical protein
MRTNIRFIHPDIFLVRPEFGCQNMFDCLLKLRCFKRPIFASRFLPGKDGAGKLFVYLYGISCGESKSSKKNSNETKMLVMTSDSRGGGQ